MDTYLLADAVDVLVAANWQRTEDGSKGRNRPKPIPRPADARRQAERGSRIEQMIAERKRTRRRPR